MRMCRDVFPVLNLFLFPLISPLFRMSPNPRAYDVLIEYCLTQDGKPGPVLSQEYKVQ